MMIPLELVLSVGAMIVTVVIFFWNLRAHLIANKEIAQNVHNELQLIRSSQLKDEADNKILLQETITVMKSLEKTMGDFQTIVMNYLLKENNQ